MSVKDSQFIPQENKDLINGYIREIQNLFPFEQNPYFTIPVSINCLCALYYTIRGQFNTELCSKNLKFIDDKTVEKINDDDYALCLFGEPLTDSMCRKFRIEFTIKQSGLHDDFCEYFGFAVASSPSDLITDLQQIEDWNICHGQK